MQLILQPYHFAVLSLNLVAPEEEGSYQAEVIIATAYQVLVREIRGCIKLIIIATAYQVLVREIRGCIKLIIIATAYQVLVGEIRGCINLIIIATV